MVRDPAKKPSILVVDDHEIVREGIRRIVGRHFKNCGITEAASHAQAMEKVFATEFDLIICDLALGGRGGIDLIQEISTLKRELPVLVYTMHAEEEYGIRAIKNGAWGYVRKGVEVGHLVEAIRELLKGKRYVSPELAQKLVNFVRQDGDQPPHEKLSNREFQVLRRLTQGAPIKEIGAELHLSVKTVSTYRARIFRKLGIQSIAALVCYSLEHGLTHDPAER